MPFRDLTHHLLRHDDAAHAIAPDHHRAAVALVLRLEADAPEVLLMQRAEHEDDRWSGQISLPGGHEEDGDESLVATAVRETREEVGVVLDPDTELLGALDPIQARTRGRLVATTITPIVFAPAAVGEIQLGPEATAAFWLPLRHALEGDLDDVHRLEQGGEVMELPAWHFEGRVVWGLTHRILGEFLRKTEGALPGARR